MTERVLLDSEKLIITKAGYDASDPTVLNNKKVFDSRWSFSGGLIHRGYHEFARVRSNDGYYAVDFPVQTFVPTAMVFMCLPPFTNGTDPYPSDDSYTIMGPFVARRREGLTPYRTFYREPVVSHSQVLIPHHPPNSSNVQGEVFSHQKSGMPSGARAGFVVLVFSA